MRVRLNSLCLLLSVVLPVLRGSGSTQEESTPVVYEDIAGRAGLSARITGGGEATKKYILESTGSGVAFFDFDRDGLIDIFLVNGSTLEAGSKAPTNHLYRNLGGNRFQDVTRRAGLSASGWGQGVCAGDFDNDGWDDLFVTYYGQNLLFRNKGNGTFAEVTHEAGLKSTKTRWGAGCAFLDFDNDGFLDLFVANYVDFDLANAPLPGSSPTSCRWKGIPVFCGPRGLEGGKNILYRNNRDGTFTDVSGPSGILLKGNRYALGVTASDLDNDGWVDIYVACDSTANILYHNNGDGTFTDIGVESGTAYNEDGREQAGMGVGVGDYDGDGYMDLVVTNFSDDLPSLYRNSSGGVFSDVSGKVLRRWNTRLLGWGTGFVDYDNDGLPDLFFANGHVYPEIDSHGLSTRYLQPKTLYRNLGDGSFEDVTDRSGGGLKIPRSARGAAFGDIDNDGDEDILVGNMNDVPTLLENRGGNTRSWLKVKLTGSRSNRSAIGARVRVVSGGRSQIGEVRSGGSWGSQSDFRVHFGLGKARTIDLVEVRWPAGSVQTLKDVAANQILHIREDGSHR